MKHRLHLIVLALALVVAALAPAGALAAPSGDPGQVVGYEKVASYATADAARAYFDDWIAFYQGYYRFPPDIPVTFDCGFDSYKVRYWTSDEQGSPTVASGMVSVPRASEPLATVLYLHGTSVSFYDAPSNPNIYGDLSPSGESFDGPPSNAVFAGGGFIYVGPDYLGLGDSTVPRHRYFHAATEASSAVDLLAAAQTVLDRLRVERDGRLYLFGFSQGGHAALAAHRALQAAGIPVTATATVGGVFDVEQWFLTAVADARTMTWPLYVSYLLLAYDDVYDVYGSTAEVFREPYASTAAGLFDMRHFFDDVLYSLPRTSRRLLTARYYADVVSDADDTMRVRLRENAVDQWRPDAPVRVYHSTTDEEVPYAGAMVSVERLRSRGANVTVETLSRLDHVNSWIQAMPRAVEWFRSLE